MFDGIKELMGIGYEMSEQELLVFNVISTLCGKEETDIKMAPLSHRYYIVNKKLQYWVRIYDESITITNHKFTYSFRGSYNFHKEVVKMLEQVIEYHRDKFEEEVFNNEMNLLDEIYSNINSLEFTTNVEK